MEIDGGDLEQERGDLEKKKMRRKSRKYYGQKRQKTLANKPILSMHFI